MKLVNKHPVSLFGKAENFKLNKNSILQNETDKVSLLHIAVLNLGPKCVDAGNFEEYVIQTLIIIPP